MITALCRERGGQYEKLSLPPSGSRGIRVRYVNNPDTAGSNRFEPAVDATEMCDEKDSVHASSKGITMAPTRI